VTGAALPCVRLTAWTAAANSTCADTARTCYGPRCAPKGWNIRLIREQWVAVSAT